MLAALRNSDSSDPALSCLIDGLDATTTSTTSPKTTSPTATLTLTPPPAGKFVKNARRVQRAGALSQSFRRMAGTVHLRPKDAAASKLGR